MSHLPEVNPALVQKMIADGIAYVPSRLLLSLTNYPEDMDIEDKKALSMLFEHNIVKIDGVCTGYETDCIDNRFVRSDYMDNIQLTFMEQVGKKFTKLIEYWTDNFVSGKEHSLNYGVKRIGIDFLLIELDEANQILVDAWLIQNAIPVKVSEIAFVPFNPHDDPKLTYLHVSLYGFKARNPKVTELAINWIQMQEKARAEAMNPTAANDGQSPVEIPDVEVPPVPTAQVLTLITPESSNTAKVDAEDDGSALAELGQKDAGIVDY